MGRARLRQVREHGYGLAPTFGHWMARMVMQGHEAVCSDRSRVASPRPGSQRVRSSCPEWGGVRIRNTIQYSISKTIPSHPMPRLWEQGECVAVTSLRSFALARHQTCSCADFVIGRRDPKIPRVPSRAVVESSSRLKH
jgi:hypothetical protein